MQMMLGSIQMQCLLAGPVVTIHSRQGPDPDYDVPQPLTTPSHHEDLFTSHDKNGDGWVSECVDRQCVICPVLTVERG